MDLVAEVRYPSRDTEFCFKSVMIVAVKRTANRAASPVFVTHTAYQLIGFDMISHTLNVFFFDRWITVIGNQVLIAHCSVSFADWSPVPVTVFDVVNAVVVAEAITFVVAFVIAEVTAAVIAVVIAVVIAAVVAVVIAVVIAAVIAAVIAVVITEVIAVVITFVVAVVIAVVIAVVVAVVIAEVTAVVLAVQIPV